MVPRTTALLVVGALALTACGTRVPEERFDALLNLEGGVEDGQSGDVATSTGGADTDTSDTSSTDLGDLGDLGSTDGDDTTTVTPGDGGDSGTSTDQDDGGTDTGGTPTTGNNGDTGDTASAEQPNQASDVGVTENSILVGNIVSETGALGPNAFAPSYYGANAYFQWLNQVHGGVHGRTIEFIKCDDSEDPAKNQECVDQMIDAGVFALVASATRAYAGAERLDDAGVPDVMGQPIGNAYWTYPHFIAVRGSEYPQDGETVGYKGRLYGGTTQFVWFKQNLDITTSAVLYYNVAASKQFGQHIADGLRKQGLEVFEYEVNFGLPNFQAVVADMQERGVDNIWDAMDANGNRNLCRTMDSAGFTVKAKATTTQGMGRHIGDYSYPCRESIYGIAEAIPYAETSNPEVQLFQEVMQTLYQGRFDDTLTQWAWEGWLAAKNFTEVVESMGPTPTREGLLQWYKDARDYTMGGLFTPLEWRAVDFDEQESKRDCLTVSNWNEEAQDFVRVSENPFCFTAPFVSYEPV